MARIRQFGVQRAAAWLAALALVAVLAAGCAVAPATAPALTEPEAVVVDLEEEALTLAYVRKAIEFFAENGLEATIERYSSKDSVEGERALVLINAEDGIVLAYQPVPFVVGDYAGPGGRYPDMALLLENATAEGFWISMRGLNPVSLQVEPRRLVGVIHEGLLFSAGHSALVENVQEATQEYVRAAIERYQSAGLDATVAYYNSQGSVEGQFYLFLIDANDIYLAHPVFPHLIGTDIKDVVGSDGQELGKEIAQATEDGAWVEYLWPHPVTRFEQKKVTWAQRHDGLLFASGYYLGEPETDTPPWRGADPREYTVAYVERAIERYKAGGLESLLNYYNSVASFEGQWYLFGTDADDIYIVHPLLPQLLGTDIKDVVGQDGFELGKELAKATEGEGVWVEYLWPHPVTLQEVPKVGYAVRYDGLLFASGYYPAVEDPVAHTHEYVQKAIAYYEENGLEATVAHYSDPASFDGQWNLVLVNEDGYVIVSGLLAGVLGSQVEDLETSDGRKFGQEAAAAARQGGGWVSFPYTVPGATESVYAHYWAIEHEGLIFASVYYDELPDVPEGAE